MSRLSEFVAACKARCRKNYKLSIDETKSNLFGELVPMVQWEGVTAYFGVDEQNKDRAIIRLMKYYRKNSKGLLRFIRDPLRIIPTPLGVAVALAHFAADVIDARVSLRSCLKSCSPLLR